MHRTAAAASAFFLLAALALPAPVAAQLDMNGVFNVTVTVPALGSTTQTTWAVVHTGTVITVDANDPGTIDLGTGAFQFRFDQFCEPQVTGTLDANGNISGTFPVYGPSPSCSGSLQAFFTGTRCGNGTLDPMEDCDPQSVCCFLCRHSPAGLACDDDLNACTADACDGAGTCAHTPLPATTACASDGQACTADHCDGAGACAHTPLPAGTANASCGACESCDGAGACGAVPLAACREVTRPGASTLRAQRFADATKDRIAWKWSKGAATTLADFGAPAQNGIDVCAWSGAAPLLAVSVPGGAAWNASPKRIVYRDAANADGITNVTLVPGIAGKSRLTVAGKGAALGLPAAGSPLATPILVQLQQDDRCWGATFTAPARNTGSKLQAKSD